MDLTQLMPRALTDADLAPIGDGRLRRLAEYWLVKRGDRVVARRVDIDPIEMKWILPHVWLHDVEPGTGRQRCRLAGEEVRAMYTTSIVGKYLDEYVRPQSWPVIKAHLDEVVNGPAIGYTIGQVYLAALDQLGHGERIALPLSDPEGRQVIMLLGATIYRPLPATTDPAAPPAGIERIVIPLAVAPGDQA